MFPLALVAQHFGMSNSRMSLNVLARSFPWIGIHVDVLRTGGRRLTPLFRSHVLFLLIQSFAYLSCNLAWRFLVYRKSSPEGFEENIFSLCSMVELFNLIFIRSVQSAGLYPKVVMASLEPALRGDPFSNSTPTAAHPRVPWWHMAAQEVVAWCSSH
eukprot:Skav203303  [mRNA]  locus=scaffold2587:14348:16115:- [translate_table: standard]